MGVGLLYNFKIKNGEKVTMDKFFNDAIIGNENIVASFSKEGELLRVCYPNVDYKQIIDFFHVGLKINDTGLCVCVSCSVMSDSL